MANDGTETYVSAIRDNLPEGTSFTNEELIALGQILKDFMEGKIDNSFTPIDSYDESFSVDADGDGIYETAMSGDTGAEGWAPEDSDEHRNEWFQRLLSTGDIRRMLPIYNYFNGLAGLDNSLVDTGPKDFLEGMAELSKNPNQKGIADFFAAHYGGPFGEEADYEGSDAQKFIQALEGLFGESDDGIEYHDLNGNGENETAVVTGDTKEEVKENAKKAVKELNEDDGADVSHHDLNGNGENETAVVSGEGEEELNEGIDEAVEGLEDDYEDEDGFDDEDEEEESSSAFASGWGSYNKPTSSDENVKDVKKKSKKDCVSDETMKNIVSTLMEYRY